MNNISSKIYFIKQLIQREREQNLYSFFDYRIRNTAFYEIELDFDFFSTEIHSIGNLAERITFLSFVINEVEYEIEQIDLYQTMCKHITETIEEYRLEKEEQEKFLVALKERISSYDFSKELGETLINDFRELISESKQLLPYSTQKVNSNEMETEKHNPSSKPIIWNGSDAELASLIIALKGNGLIEEQTGFQRYFQKSNGKPISNISSSINNVKALSNYPRVFNSVNDLLNCQKEIKEIPNILTEIDAKIKDLQALKKELKVVLNE